MEKKDPSHSFASGSDVVGVDLTHSGRDSVDDVLGGLDLFTLHLEHYELAAPPPSDADVLNEDETPEAVIPCKPESLNVYKQIPVADLEQEYQGRYFRANRTLRWAPTVHTPETLIGDARSNYVKRAAKRAKMLERFVRRNGHYFL